MKKFVQWMTLFSMIFSLAVPTVIAWAEEVEINFNTVETVETENAEKSETSPAVHETEIVDEEKVAPIPERPKASTIREKEPTTSETTQLTILGSSDVHGNVWDYSYEDDQEKR